VDRVFERVDALSDWGIDPVPGNRRLLGTLDIAVLWGDLGVGLLVLVTGSLLVPGLGFSQAAIVVVVGSLMGVFLLALASTPGARYGIPTMVLLRPVLGLRGSWLPSAFNVLQLIGWTAVELWAISLVADIVSQRVFDFSNRLLWLALTAIVCTLLALWGPIGVARVWMKKFGAWIVVAICVLITALALGSESIRAALGRPGTGAFPTFGPALDLVIAMPVSWLPLVADYTRFSHHPRSAFAGTFFGYLIANIWLYLLGAILLLSGSASPDPAGIATGVLALAGGTIAGVVFLVGLLMGETDEAFADIYSAALSLRNIFPGASQRFLTIVTALLSAGLAAWLTMDRYEAFLFLLGSVFVPLFGVLAADHFVVRRGEIDVSALYRHDGPYWFNNGVRVRSLIPWIAGFLAYHWVLPTGPQWWIDAVEAVIGSPLSKTWPWASASVFSFGVAFLLALGRRRTYNTSHENRG
jgi:nucleobase:cation symporter-1, NCS1 family